MPRPTSSRKGKSKPPQDPNPGDANGISEETPLTAATAVADPLPASESASPADQPQTREQRQPRADRADRYEGRERTENRDRPEGRERDQNQSRDRIENRDRNQGRDGREDNHGPREENRTGGDRSKDRDQRSGDIKGGSGNKDRVAANSINIAKLQAMSMGDLNSMARELGVENFGTMRKHEVIFHVLQKNAERSGVLFSEGVLEVLPEGFGFLRSQSFNYLPC